MMHNSLLDLEYYVNLNIALSTLRYNNYCALWSQDLQKGQETGNMDESSSLINYLFQSTNTE